MAPFPQRGGGGSSSTDSPVTITPNMINIAVPVAAVVVLIVAIFAGVFIVKKLKRKGEVVKVST